MHEIERLSGVLPALASPLLEDGEVDAAGTRRLVRHVIDGGVSGVLVLGSTGEVASLDEVRRRRLLELVVDEVGGLLPVLCGVARDEVAGAAEEIAAAAAAGADGVLVAPPHYYPTDQATVAAFYRRLASTSRLPILVYNIPQFTKVWTEPATLKSLAEEGAIAGIKDSSRDFEYFSRVAIAVRDLPAFRLFTGSDGMLLASMLLGGAGTICGSANVAPSWVVRIHDAVVAGALDSARLHQFQLIELVEAIRAGVFPTAIKAALSFQGICGPWPAPPGTPLLAGAQADLRDSLERLGLPAASPAASGE